MRVNGKLLKKKKPYVLSNFDEKLCPFINIRRTPRIIFFVMKTFKNYQTTPYNIIVKLGKILYKKDDFNLYKKILKHY